MTRLAVIFTFLISWAPVCMATGPENLLLVVNESSSDSVAVGEYFARMRGVPDENICRLNLEPESVVSRNTFEEQIRNPLADHIRRNRLQDRILYIVTTRGVPLAIEGDAGPVGDFAAVDSELALLYRFMVYGEYSAYGRIDNPYFALDFPQNMRRPFTRRDFDFYLVTRLDGASLADVIFMIERGMQAEARGSVCFDLPSQRRTVSSEWLQEAYQYLKEQGKPVCIRSPGNSSQLASEVLGYASLDGAGMLSLFGSQPSRLQKGSIALLMDRDNLASEDSPARLLVHGGASGVAAYVGDPTVDGYARPQILFASYLAGNNLAESFYRSTRYLSWRQVVLGDPLVSPFAAERSGSGPAAAGVHRETGWPEHFYERRRQYLLSRYNTGEEVVRLLLEAEAAAERGDEENALNWVGRSIELDSHLPQAHRLKADLAERKGDFETAFRHYRRLLDLAGGNAQLYQTLARLALDEMDDPEAAEPYARWLFSRLGAADREIALLWAEVNWRQGKQDRAEAVYYNLVADTENPPPPALQRLGKISLEKGQLDAAEGFFRRASEEGADPGEIEAQLEKLAEARGATLDVEKEAAAQTAQQQSQYPTREARIVSRAPLEYPTMAVREGTEGRVVLLLLIDERGQLMKVRPLIGEKRLAEAAIKSVRQWQFEPKLVRGRPVADYMSVAVEFQLTQPE